MIDNDPGEGGGGGDGAQGAVHGSLACWTVNTNGGWNLHYDESFDEDDVLYFSIWGIREDPAGSSSFILED